MSAIQEKELKNIKRRVYDALNVLINAGILKKTGKKVEATPESRLNGKRFCENYSICKNLETENLSKRKTVIQKHQILKHRLKRYICLCMLHYRNLQLKTQDPTHIEMENIEDRYLKTPTLQPNAGTAMNA